MAIEIINGDVLDAFSEGKLDAIAHCCNMQNTFGSGIAKSVLGCFPKAYEADTTWYKSRDTNNVPLSVAAFHSGSEDVRKRMIFNLYGQEFYGTNKRQLNYGRLAKSLIAMESWLEKDSIVGFPYKMGSDRAGGDFEIVLEMIEFFFQHHNVKIYKLE